LKRLLEIRDLIEPDANLPQVWQSLKNEFAKSPEQGGNKDLAKRSGAELECAQPEMVTPRRYQPTRQTMERVRSQKILRDNVLAGPRLIVCDAGLLLLLLAVRPLVL